jgi:hypothetical protein
VLQNSGKNSFAGNAIILYIWLLLIFYKFLKYVLHDCALNALTHFIVTGVKIKIRSRVLCHKFSVSLQSKNTNNAKSEVRFRQLICNPWCVHSRLFNADFEDNFDSLIQFSVMQKVDSFTFIFINESVNLLINDFFFDSLFSKQQNNFKKWIFT